MRREAWAYVSGVCEARESAFFNERWLAELGSLPPEELGFRLARSFFGPVEPLSAFDAVARERRNREFAEIAAISPEEYVVALIRIGFAAGQMRRRLNEIPDDASSGELEANLQRISFSAQEYSEDFARELAGPWPSPEHSARQAASLLLDSVELLLKRTIAETSNEELVIAWGRSQVQVGGAKVSLRVVKLCIPREKALFFFRERLEIDNSREFLSDYNSASALMLYPAGVQPGLEDDYLYSILKDSSREPYSAARVLRYLIGFLRQESMLRRAVYISLGRLPREEAA
jgi:hypothetical protein